MSKLSTILLILVLAVSALTSAIIAATNGLNTPVLIGDLTYTQANSASREAQANVYLADNGGTANDGVVNDPFLVFLPFIAKANAAPVANGQSVSAKEDTLKTITLSGTDDGGSQTFSIVSGPSNGTLGSLGSVICVGFPSVCTMDVDYTPAANFNGSDNFTFKMNDGLLDSNTATVNIIVDAVNDAPAAATHSYNAQANMKIVGLTGLLNGATDPDTGDSGYIATFTVGEVSATTPAGGVISNLNASAGTFDFDPPPGASGDVTFTYTVCDNGNPLPSACSAPATVTVNLAGPVIWFVNPAAVGNGDGRLSNPFNNLASAAAVDASGQRIFLYSGTATNGIMLNTNEWLIGQGVTGASFDAVFSISPSAGTIARPSIGGTRPVIQGNVVMATSDSVRGLNVQPASGTTGLTTSSATGLTVGEISVTTTNATAVSLINSDGTFSFTSISASGGPNGIVWSNSSAATGSLTVNGDSANTTLGGNASGGTISNMSGSDGTTAGIGIYINNARNVTLRRMTINGTNQNFGIRGIGVTNFTLEYSTVSGVNGTSTPNREGSVIFDNMFGSNTVNSSIISGAIEDNLRVENTTGTLTAFNLTNSTIQNNSIVSGNIGFRFATATPGVTMTGTVSGTTFRGNRTDAINVDASNGTVNITISNNQIIAGTGGDNQGNIGIDLTVGNNGGMTFVVEGNKIGTDGITNQPLLNTGINIFNATLVTSGVPAAMTGTVQNNTVYNAGGGISGFGIRLFNQGYGSMNANVSGNVVNNVGLDYGIFVEVSSNSGTANTAGLSSIAMTGNTANVLSGALDAIRVQARGRSTMCARINNNVSSTFGTGFFGLEIRQAPQTISSVTYQATFNLEGLASGLQTEHNTIVNYLNNQNPAIPGGADEIHSAGITGVAANSCSSIP